MCAFLDDCARSTAGGPEQISYPTLEAASRGQLLKLRGAICPSIVQLLRRQATLQALVDVGRTPEVMAYCNGDPFPFASAGVSAIRSSHSGAPIDARLPQGPYPATPGGAVPAWAVGVRAIANYRWLQESTTDHTTDPDPASGLPADPGRVASYLELGAKNVYGPGGEALLDGTRVVYDPYNHRMFVSEHYRKEYELTNLPTVIADPVYQPLHNELTQYAAAQVAGVPPWAPMIQELEKRMYAGTL